MILLFCSRSMWWSSSRVQPLLQYKSSSLAGRASSEKWAKWVSWMIQCRPSLLSPIKLRNNNESYFIGRTKSSWWSLWFSGGRSQVSILLYHRRSIQSKRPTRADKLSAKQRGVMCSTLNCKARDHVTQFPSSSFLDIERYVQTLSFSFQFLSNLINLITYWFHISEIYHSSPFSQYGHTYYEADKGNDCKKFKFLLSLLRHFIATVPSLAALVADYLRIWSTQCRQAADDDDDDQ